MIKEDFLYNAKKRGKLSAYPTTISDSVISKEEGKKLFEESSKRLSELQDRLFANNKHGLLVVIQGLDASGKDSTIRHIMANINPQGFTVASFKSPTSEELDHDYMWRCFKQLPERGNIALFNRSYYEEAIYVRLHENILKKQNLPNFSSELFKNENFWATRLADIKNFEKYLINNSIHILKIYLHISKEEQKIRFLKRINLPEKNWKFSLGDIADRKYWDFYQEIYEKAFMATSTEDVPWYIVPADRKWYARAIVSQLIVDKLESLKLEYPELTEKMKSELNEGLKILEDEK